LDHMNTSSTQLSVGKELVSYCTRCKMDLGHTIVSMTGGIPARVICRTCKSEHNYKPKKGVKEPGAIAPSRGSPGTSSRAPREAKVEKTVPVELEWMKQINANTRAIRTYAANEAFQPGDRISHPSFGEGIIQKLIHPNKVEVLFKMDLKVLIHSGKPA
jgi:hypothetical protein